MWVSSRTKPEVKIIVNQLRLKSFVRILLLIDTVPDKNSQIHGRTRPSGSQSDPSVWQYEDLGLRRFRSRTALPKSFAV